MGTDYDIGIGKRLRLAHMAFSRALRLELAQEGISFGQFVHLDSLWAEDGLTQTELSRRVGIETASSTTILDELEKKTLITRVRSAEDRRRVNIFLTPEGTAMRDALLRRAAAVNATAKSGVAPADLHALFATLARLTDSLVAAYPQAGRPTRKERLGP
ncbi:MarR family winged helix-turn-helix transcriptional regulator [Lichenifustis flavocetrariae]|uniref:MarR family transcriptional regulator n=1 Tax=Lichenifustis flavocetrariae TaxID=2949735 RepID=A0AA41YUZ6_9HYPH|nr:MarR family transcriptional regulator [Lichenifustis flavocetrariae]MCW6507815.1 MarR family transcriptional regulator [Lichenifustis flavocetrariae]